MYSGEQFELVGYLVDICELLFVNQGILILIVDGRCFIIWEGCFVVVRIDMFYVYVNDINEVFEFIMMVNEKSC